MELELGIYPASNSLSHHAGILAKPSGIHPNAFKSSNQLPLISLIEEEDG